MDSVTLALSSLDIPFFTIISIFLHEYGYLLFFTIAFLLFLFYPKVRRNRLKVLSFFISLFLVLILVYFLKQAYHVKRECVNLKLQECPIDFSFPSGHTAMAFTFSGASLGTSFFPIFFVLAITMAISRMYLGLHTLIDVSGGLAISLAIYFITEDFMRRKFPSLLPPDKREEGLEGKKRDPHLEKRRQAFHIIAGSIIMLLIYILTLTKVELLLMLSIFVGMTLMHLRMERKNVLFVDALFDRFERSRVVPGKGAFMFMLGSLLALILLKDVQKTLVVIGLLTWGDGMATIVGGFGGPRLPYNEKKSILGTATFLLFGSILSFLFIGWFGIAVAIVCAIAESLPTNVDDNLLIPIIASLMLSI